MINVAFRLFLTFNSVSLLLIVFIVQKGYVLSHFFPNYFWLVKTPNIFSYLIYFLTSLLLTGLSILMSSYLGKDEFKQRDVESMEHANNSFLPSYLGYFFVALSISNWETLGFVYSLLFIFTFLSQALYFNPIFLIFGYEFYNIKTKNGTSIFLISRKKYRSPNEIDIPAARRINNYTFIERD